MTEQTQATQGAITSGLIDVLTVVHAFVCKFAQIDAAGVPKLEPEQVLRGWQALGLLPSADEVCIITLINSTRTSLDSPTHCLVSDNEATEPSQLQIEQRLEHVVQIDFAGVSQRIDSSVTKRRADQIYMIAHSPYAPNFFHSISPDFSCLYCDPPISFGELDGSHALRHRHTLSLHVSENQYMRLPVSTFGKVALRSENALVSHKP